MGSFIPHVYPTLLELPGSKIYQQNPRDLDVKYFYAKTIGGSAGKPSCRDRAVLLLKELQRQNPKDIRYVWLQADIYDRAWDFNKRDKYSADKAILHYREYLKVSGLNAQASKGVFKRMADINRIRKEWEDWDKKHPR